MGNGILFITNCCSKNNNDIKDIDINKIENNIHTIKDFRSPTKGTQNENYYETLMKTDFKRNKYKRNEFLTFKKRNYTQKFFKKNANLMHINTLRTLKNSKLISPSNVNIFRNKSNNFHYNSYFNTQASRLGKFTSSFNFSSGVRDKYDGNFKKIKTKLKLAGELFSNKKLLIDKYGLKHNYKKEFNGIISFGISNVEHSSYDYIFDSHVTEKLNKNKKYQNCKIFDILLDKTEKLFVLFLTHSSFLLYYKINEKINLDFETEYYFILGNVFMTINIKNMEKLKIHIEIKNQNEKTKKYSFGLKDLPIKIGRENCNINIPKPSISKLHSYIYYENGVFWYKDEYSKNGSTLVMKKDDYVKIKGKMNFKLEDIPFTIEEINENHDIKEENTNIHINIDNKEYEEEEEDEYQI